MNTIHSNDPLELELAQTLITVGIDFIHESSGEIKRLDFYLPDYDIYIEIKRYHSERSVKQLALQDNIILIQGVQSLDFFKKLLLFIKRK